MKDEPYQSQAWAEIAREEIARGKIENAKETLQCIQVPQFIPAILAVISIL